LLNHTAKTKGYSGSGAVTGDLWGNDGIDLLRALHGCGAVTGDLWGNDGI
jgi:hypothetical protein